ncbi:MAG: hypothetical protein ACAH83_17540 [Alphaproteobacteria bacterium]
MYDPGDPRELTAAALVRRGSATMRELLAMAYGEWPLKGLDINENVPHDQKVTLAADPNLPDLGSTNSCQRDILINDRLCRTEGDGIASTLGHEALHVLQADNFWADRLKEIYGIDQVPKLVEGRNLHARTSTIAMSDVTAFDNTVKAFVQSFNAVADSGNVAYLKRGEEMQARLHQTMMAGYPAWGKMPGNMDELWAAMKEFGLTPPPDIEKHLRSLPQNSSARDFMKSGAQPFVARELEKVNLNLTEAARAVLWRQTLPMLYADLIEMFGDSKGRERFGFGANIRGQAQLAAFGKKTPSV